MTYAEIVERALVQVQQKQPAFDWDRLRVAIDSAFFQINSTTAEVFAAVDSKREMLRAARTLTFTDGSATLSSDVLKKYIEDGTFTVTGAKYSYRSYPDFLRAYDRRLGYWTLIGETLRAKKPINGIPLTGDVDTTFIQSPPVPALQNSTFVAPDDYLPELIGALVQYALGQIQQQAAATA